jgi:glycosyltransferase involved in cell wall biosynthesis
MSSAQSVHPSGLLLKLHGDSEAENIAMSRYRFGRVGLKIGLAPKRLNVRRGLYKPIGSKNMDKMNDDRGRAATHPTDAPGLGCELTILIPCLNESDTVGICIDKARAFLEREMISGEVVVADNGSTDGSRDIAMRHGARVVEIEQKGYGSALLGGIAAARGRYVIMGDADDSYDFTALMPFVEALRQGNHLVMGNRFKGGIRAGAMPLLHRYLGNPVLTGIGRLFFKSPVGDFHCGLRGFDRCAILNLELRATGMEFASEMIVKASLGGLRIAEVPTTLSPDGRNHPPHLRSWRDGWRHLRFLLLFSPRWLFLYPGLLLFVVGLGLLLWLLPGPRLLVGVNLDIHTMLFGAAATILGFQSVSFAVFAKMYGMSAGFLGANDRLSGLLGSFTLEMGLVIGTLVFAGGLIGSVTAIYVWGSGDFGDLVPSSMMRIIIPSVTGMVVGAQLALSAFLLSVLRIPIRQGPSPQSSCTAPEVKQRQASSQR